MRCKRKRKITNAKIYEDKRDLYCSSSLAVGHGSKQVGNLDAAFNVFFHRRISDCGKNFVRQRAHLNVWGFDISAEDFRSRKKRDGFSAVGLNTKGLFRPNMRVFFLLRKFCCGNSALVFLRRPAFFC